MEREAGLLRHLPHILGQRELLIPFEVAGADVHRVTACTIGAAAHQRRQLLLRVLDPALEALKLLKQLSALLRHLSGGPQLLAFEDRQNHLIVSGLLRRHCCSFSRNGHLVREGYTRCGATQQAGP